MGHQGHTGESRHGSTEPRLLCDKEVAKFLGVSEVTLADWRRLKKGPPFVRLEGRMVRYRASDIEAWLAAQEIRPSRIVGSPQGGLGQQFERLYRRTPVENAAMESVTAGPAVDRVESSGIASPESREVVRLK
jgi:predicted DNA-binding transcriptional regulator AlpA